MVNFTWPIGKFSHDIPIYLGSAFVLTDLLRDHHYNRWIPPCGAIPFQHGAGIVVAFRWCHRCYLRYVLPGKPTNITLAHRSDDILSPE